MLRWSSQPHGSQWVYRQAIHFMREEFMTVASSPVLFQLDKTHLIDVIKSDFLQVQIKFAKFKCISFLYINFIICNGTKVTQILLLGQGW